MKIDIEEQQWIPGDTAPRTGEEFEAIVNGMICPLRWAESRKCMLAGIGGGNGYFGEGWEQTDVRLISDPPEYWRPIE